MAKKDGAKNFAEDKEYAQDLMAKMINIWREVKANREDRERKWLDAYYAWSASTTEIPDSRNYRGRANLKVPQLRKEIETMSRRLVKGLFRDDYLKAMPNGLENEKTASVNAMLVRHYFDNKMNFKQSVMPWIKQCVTYGNSPIRQYWKKETNKQMFRKREFVQGKDGILVPKNRTVYEDVTLYDAPFAETCDLFQTWVYPDTAANPSQIQCTFFRTKVDLSWLKEREKMGLCVLPEGIDEMGTTSTQEFDKTQERLAEFGATGYRTSLPGERLYDFMECWTKIILPGHDKPISVVIEILDEAVCIRIQQNPYWHQAAPFQWARYIMPFPGDFYARGLPEAMIPMQSQLDDIMNQTMDSTTLALNPITVVNPAYAPNADSFEVEPGAVWFADPAAVKQFSFPDLSETGIRNAGLLKSMISELSDNQPQLPDPIAGKARSTGQAQMAINEWQTDVYNFLEQISNEALGPLASQTHALIQQNISDDAVIRVTGKLANEWIYKVITPDDIAGNYEFKWIGSIQAETQSVRTQQMLNLLKILPMIPKEAGINLNWQNFMVRVLKDGFDLRNIEEIIETDSMRSSVPPEIENRMLEMGGDIDVRKSDNDDLHINFHRALESSDDPLVRAKIAAHIAEHEIQKKAKMEAMMQQQMMMQMQMQQQVQGRGPRNPQGNQAQLSEATNPGDLQRGIRP